MKCVAFRSSHRYWKFKPRDGLAVLARGRVDVYEARGEYQLLVEMLEPQGLGALQLAFEQLKKKLAAEGLFEAARKRPLPRFPRRIGIVTSPRGAAIADLVQILTRRSPGLHIRLFPALVQGEGSVEEVCRGIEYFSRTRWADLVIVGRGGGSLEDLWTFNAEAVARAIAACAVPVVAAVGHETDVTIADFVADLRAPTPSAAAELVVPNREDLLSRVAAARAKTGQALRYRLAMLERRLRQQGIDRALSLLHRRLGRGMQLHRRAGLPSARAGARRHWMPANAAAARSRCASRDSTFVRAWLSAAAAWSGPTSELSRSSGCNWLAGAPASSNCRRILRSSVLCAFWTAATRSFCTRARFSKMPPPLRRGRPCTSALPKGSWTPPSRRAPPSR